jgi:DNA-binding GntR family transcriptional regulator
MLRKRRIATTQGRTRRDSVSDVLASSVAVDGQVPAELAAYRYVLHRIRRGELGPGARLRTEEIAASIGTSRQPVREALRRLEAEGYLTSRPNCGAMVSAYTAQQLLELFEIRAALECLAVRLAAARATPADLAHLEKLHLSLDWSAADPQAWLSGHAELHLYLVGLANRPRLSLEIARSHAALEPYLRLWLVQAGTPENSQDEHGRLLKVLRYGYPQHVEDLMRDHILSTATQLVAYLDTVDAAPAAEL